MTEAEREAMSLLARSGLVSETPEAELTQKGREWLRIMEAIQEDEVANSLGSPAADLILATSSIVR